MLGIVVGLAAEARLARRLGGQVAIGGGDAAGAGRAGARLADAGAQALLSFGLAGGLDPALPPGALVVPCAVLDRCGSAVGTDAALSRRLGTAAGTMLAAEAVLASRAAKAAAWTATGALAVDLESGAVARAARARGLPFAVLRAVCDPADSDLPPAALTALDERGGISPAALIRSLVRRPGQLPGLIALGREAALARKALLACVTATGPVD